MLKELAQRIQHMVKTGTITNAVNTSGDVHTCQVSTFQGQEVHNDRPMYGTWGMASVPPTNSQAITLSGYGLNNNRIVVGTHDVNTHPKNLKQGEVQLYDTSNQSLYLSVNGVVVTAKDLFEVKLGQDVLFSISKDKVIFNANIEVNGSITSTDEITSGGIKLTQHKHTGVQSGSSETGTPT